MTFDPLHKWLGIPPSEQPPNHYRLLGVPLFEDDLDVIEAAADKQLAFLHDMANSPESRAADELSNRVSAARLCLCNKSKKTAYDFKLRQEIESGETSRGTGATQANPHSPVLEAKAAPSWMLRYDDGRDHGPYSFDSLLEAARRGYITQSTAVRHPLATKSEWVPALSLAQLAQASPASASDVSVRPDVAVSLGRTTQPFNPSSSTRPRRKSRSIRSRLSSMVATGIPVAVLAILTAAVYRSPQLRDSLRDALSLSTEAEQANLDEELVQPDHRPQRPRPRHNGRRIPIEGPTPDLSSNEQPSNRSPRTEDAFAESETSDTEQTLVPANPQTKEEWHYLKLDLANPRWSVTLEDANQEDQFFVHRIEEVRQPISVEPISGELHFDQSTSVALRGLDGLEIELSLMTSGDPPQIRLIGHVLFYGKHFRYRNLLKQWNGLGKQISSANAAIQAGTSRRVALRSFLDSSGPKPLNRVHQATKEIKAINQRLTQLTKNRDAVQVRWNQIKSIVTTIEQINEKGELVVSSVRTAESSSPSVTQQP